MLELEFNKNQNKFGVKGITASSGEQLIDDLIALNIDVYKFIAHTLLSDKYNADKFISNIDESWLKHPIFNLYKNLK